MQSKSQLPSDPFLCLTQSTLSPPLKASLVFQLSSFRAGSSIWFSSCGPPLDLSSLTCAGRAEENQEDKQDITEGCHCPEKEQRDRKCVPSPLPTPQSKGLRQRQSKDLVKKVLVTQLSCLRNRNPLLLRLEPFHQSDSHNGGHLRHCTARSEVRHSVHRPLHRPPPPQQGPKSPDLAQQGSQDATSHRWRDTCSRAHRSPTCSPLGGLAVSRTAAAFLP